MKIKSLLLGSAAALVAATGARAADAVIIPEPHLVEYVRVCDTYGTGFFYIPGTETCLKIDGYVRYEMNFTSTGSDAEVPEGFIDIDGHDDWGKRAEMRLNIDARNETELGTLRSYIRIGHDTSPRNTASVEVDEDRNATLSVGDSIGLRQAYIQLGGLQIGKAASWWDYQPGADGDGLFNGGPGDIGMISYTVNAGGFGWTLALEEDESGNYMPDVVFDMDGSVGDFSLRAGVAYNESAEAFTAKFRAGYDFGVAAVQFGYQYSDEDALGAEYLSAFEHVVGADISADFTEKVSARAGFNYGIDNLNGDDGYRVGAGINYELVEGFDIDARMNYQDGDALEDADGDGIWTGRIRFTRSF